MILTGLVSTLAGSVQGFSNGPGSAAKFNNIRGICFDSLTQSLLVSDNGNDCVRRVNIMTGT